MKSTSNPHPDSKRRASIPLWLGFALALLVWGVMPWALSLLTDHIGWTTGHLILWNLLGLIPVALGAAGLLWGLLIHSTQTPQRLDWEPAKNYLLKDGPYRFSRNPMYLSELVLMFGWVIFYGSASVLIGFLAWAALFVFYQVPLEERILEESFGEAYHQYKIEVPRWIGKSRRQS